MIIADTHLHLYPHYDLATAVRDCVVRMSALAPGATCAGYLAERSGCRVFRALMDGGGGTFAEGVAVESMSDGRSLALRGGFGAAPLYISPGRQIVTQERLEILCLSSDAEIPDGLPAAETVGRIREVDGVPVLTWAVGKWLFRRAKVVRSLLDSFGPGELLVGDSAMRPVFWPTPAPMRTALRRDYSVIAGTDPLPARGEERVMGRYASLFDAELDPGNVGASLRNALLIGAAGIKCVGNRSFPLTFFRR